MTQPPTLKPPKGMRAGQALYNFLFWLQETKQTDTFYMSNEVIIDFYKEWLSTLKK